MQTEHTIGVELRGAAKSYRTAGTVVPAVRGIDMSIDRGETVALLGPNGAGKSTTIDMVLGLTAPDSGTVSLLGGPPKQAVAGGLVGVMLQAGALVRDVTVRELLTMMAALHSHPLGVGEALELAGLADIADRRTQKLSGGQAQRVRFALALVSDPAVLILDEPTVGMDVEARRAFWLSVRALAGRGKTVIFATHYLEEADAYADRAVLMSQGRIVADGPTNEIRARVGTRAIRATLPDAALAAALEGGVNAERAVWHRAMAAVTQNEEVAAALEASAQLPRGARRPPSRRAGDCVTGRLRLSANATHLAGRAPGRSAKCP